MTEVREEEFEMDGLRLTVALPVSSDDLIDVSEFNQDERLPYWAELWPSARALASHLMESGPRPSRALELGCGVGLPSLVLRSLGWEVLATDYYEDALRFVVRNAERNGIPAPLCRMVDWREPPRDLGRWPLVVAADVLYEERNIHSFAGVLDATLDEGGRVLLADPGRSYLRPFLNHMQSSGWTTELLETRAMEPVRDDTPRTRVQIWTLGRGRSAG